MDIFFDKEFRELIPVLRVEEYSQLEASLKAEGNRDPIVIWKEKSLLLDGHNRYDICTKNNIPLKPSLPLSFTDRDAAKIWIIDNQLGRRNLAPATRIELALLKEDIIRQRAREKEHERKTTRQNSDKSFFPIIDTKEELAKAAKVSHDTIWKYKQIREKLSPEQKAKLGEGKATINQVYVSIKRDEVKANLKDTPWPSGKYRVIYADPPWKYSNNMPTDGESTGLYTEQQDHYKVEKTPSEIAGLPVIELALDNAVLFLWVTSPILEQAFDVINAWEFKYKTSFIWDKVKRYRSVLVGKEVKRNGLYAKSPEY